MVISTFHEDWQERLARLKRCVADQPDGPVWLWTIRIRTLEFIASRHGESERHGKPPAVSTAPRAEEVWKRGGAIAADAMDSPSDDTLGPALLWHLFPIVGSPTTECPPRSRDAMNPVLASLQQINDANRMRLDRSAPLQDVWLWWREEWCCRRSRGK